MKRYLLYYSLSILLLACSPPAQVSEKEMLGVYSGILIPPDNVDTVGIDAMLLMAFMGGIDMEFQFDTHGKLIDVVTIDGQQQTFHMRWELIPGDTLCIIDTSRMHGIESFDKFKIYRTSDGFDLHSPDYTLQLTRR